MPSSETMLLSVVTRLVDDEAIPARLLALGDAAAILMMVDKSLTALFTPAFGPRDAIEGRLRTIVEDNPGVHIKLAIVGGEPDVRELLPRGGGLLARRAVQLFHLGPSDDGWTLWTGGGARPDSPLGRVLDQAARGELPPPDPAALAERVDAPEPLSEPERARLEQSQAFIKSLHVRPRVTWGLLGVLVVIFGCEVWWGGSETIPTLVRMGGNTDAALAGEPWRLLSSALLHAGYLHIAVNGYVLLMLGGFMEKVLAPARYGVLLGGAALGGGLASALLSPSLVSVGASGAIWGVLGAAAALAWRPSTVIPPMLVAPLRRNALINLGLGLSVSFLPQVDLWAHLGGGAAGAALVLGGVVTRGVGTEAEAEAPRSSRFTRAAGLVAGLMAASLAVAWVTDRPWELAADLTWSRQPLADGVAPELPTLLGEARALPPEVAQQAWALGDELRDPLVVTVVLLELDDATRAASLERYRGDGLQTPEDTEVRRAWRARPAGAWPTYEVEYAYPNGLIGGFWVQLRDDAELRMHTLRWPTSSDRWGGAVERIYASVEGPTPPDPPR